MSYDGDYYEAYKAKCDHRFDEDAMLKRERLEELAADWPEAREHANRCAVRRRAIRPHLNRRLQRGRRA